MNIDEYAERTQRVFTRSLMRATTIGAEHYSLGDEQRFESKPLPVIKQDVLEEIEDAIVYLAQLHIRINALRLAETE